MRPVMRLDSPGTPPPPLTSFTGCRSPTLMRSCLTRRQVDWITMTFGLCMFTLKTASGLSQTAKPEIWTTAYAVLFILFSSSLAGPATLQNDGTSESTIDLLTRERMTDLVRTIGKSSLAISRRPVGTAAASQLRTTRADNSGSPPQNATTRDASLCVRMKS